MNEVDSNTSKWNLTGILLIMLAAIIAAIAFNILAESNRRWAMYIFGAPIVIVFLLRIKDSVYLVSSVVFVLLFFEKTLISRRWASPFFGVGISLIFACIVWATLLRNRAGWAGVRFYYKPFFLFILALIPSMGFGSYESSALLNHNLKVFIQYYLEFFLFFCIGCLAFQNIKEIKRFFFVLILFGILLALGHLLSISFEVSIESLRRAAAVREEFNIGGANWRYGGFFYNFNNLAAFYVMFIPMAFLYLYYEKRMLYKTIIAGALILMSISLLLGGSRAGIVFALINILIALYFLGVDLKKIIIIFILILLFAMIISFVLQEFFPELFDRSFGRMLVKGLSSPRYKLWKGTIRLLFDNPLGIGLSSINYLYAIGQYSPYHYANPHNIYLEFATHGGFAGMIIALWVLVKSYLLNFNTYKRSIHPDEKKVVSFFLVTIAGFMLMGITEPIFINSIKLNHLAALILGISATFSSGREKDLAI
ncbi:MAG: O-antigen ligase family protein [bacterium]|nr:O-antigen ligase family protein [bacterium]